MRHPKLLIVAGLTVFALSVACVYGFAQVLKGKTAVKTAPAKAAAPARGVDGASMDRTADPCVDFYQYACGGWRAAHPVPADRASFSRFAELLDRNQDVLHDILEKAAPDNPSRSPLEKKIGDYYASCMDEAAIDQKGLAPLQPELDRIAGLGSKEQLADEVAHLYPRGVRPFFGFRAAQDFKDATQMIASVGAGGMGLPDRDYYLKQDAKSVDLRTKYQEHVQKMLQLSGEGESQAAAGAKSVMDIETALAKVSLDRIARREPTNVYHKMSKQEFAALSPAFAWDRFLTGVQAPPIASLNVAEPEFVKGLQAVIQNTDLDALKAYLRWHTLSSAAPMLPAPFVQEQFNFSDKVLRGVEQMEPRWRRCVRSTDRQLGELLGQPYVERNFGPSAKQRTLRMVQEIEAAMEADIKALPWMTEATKQQALVKLHAVANKIGYPDAWRDYSKLTVTRGDALGNALRADVFDFRRNLDKIGKPVDKKEWGMTPPTVNAYYSPNMNNINFPAGILQPPFYDQGRDEAINYGGVGAVVGHELTHGFDDQGRKYDPNGNLRDWWTAPDATEFEKRTGCEVNEYDSFVATEDAHVKGKLTLGENTADNGGVKVAMMALHDRLSTDKKAAAEEKTLEKKEGFTPEQRFFLGFAQIWCENRTDESARLLAKTDPHSPGQYRVNGTVQNSADFAKAFQCKAGQPMVSANACRVW